MLTRSLVLSAGWLAIAFLATILFGARARRSSTARSILWLGLVLLLGDAWALLTFGVPVEIAALTGFTFAIGVWWSRRLTSWNAFGQVTWTTAVLVVALYLAYSFAVTAFTPLHLVSFGVAIVFYLIEVAAFALALTYTYESLDVMCRVRWKHRVDLPMPASAGYFPKVSVHVPAYNEPPEVVEATLRKLALLDYPDFEVLLVDNNTPDTATWRAAEAVCRDLGPRFRFLHLDRWPGYKSGALNFALAQTVPDAEVIAIVDADYQVDSGFLRELAPSFADPAIAFVQTPQDYRDHSGNAFLEACYNAYNYFFAVAMPVRNEHNAIIFSGTMGLIRKSALQEIGGWDEWCITEDAEASLRLLKLGYQSLYIHRTYGRGLMPYSFDGLKRQRFRWCFGGIQILRRHWEALMPWARWSDPANHLSFAQRYFYLTGGLQWFSELLNLAFAFFLILGGILRLLPGSPAIRPFTDLLLVIPSAFLLVGLVRFVWVLRHVLSLSLGVALMTMASFFSLSWTIALASIQGLVQPVGVFLRTPKTKSRLGLVRALRVTQWEAAVGVICLLVASTAAVGEVRPAGYAIAVLLVWQASLYLSAPVFSLLSLESEEAASAAAEARANRAEHRGRAILEGGAARLALAGILVLLIGAGTAQWLSRSTATSAYSHLQPEPVPLQRIVGLDPVPLDQRSQPSGSAAPLPTATATATPSPTPTVTPTTPGAAAPATPGTTAVPSTAPTQSPTPHHLPPTDTATPLPTSTRPSGPAPTPTRPPTATATPKPTSSPTPIPKPTSSPTPTPRPGATRPPTSTPRPAPTRPATPTHRVPQAAPRP